MMSDSRRGLRNKGISRMTAILVFSFLAAAMVFLPVQSFSAGYGRAGRAQIGFWRSVGRSDSGFRADMSFKREINFDDTDDPELQLRKDALELLDCITSPKDEDDPGYDVVKDMRRDEVLFNNDHSALKVELRARGLRQTGDKMEMIARLLLHIIDPTINYSQMTGREVNLKYVDEVDLATNKIRVVPIEERETDPGSGSGPDAEDLMVLKRKVVLSSPKNAVGGKATRSVGSRVVARGEVHGVDTFDFEKIGDIDHQDELPQGRDIDVQKTVMDGLTRRELEFSPLRVKRSVLESEEDKDASIRSYVVGGRNVLKSWERNSAVIVLLPDEKGWRDKDVRVFADEISFFNQAIVVVPDLYRGRPWSKSREEKYKQVESATSNSTSLTNRDSKDDLDDSNSKQEFSVEYKAWLKSHSEKRIFDDISSTLRFSEQQYDSKALSLAGIGCGGGWALKAACDLSDIQCAAALEVYNSEKKKEKNSGDSDSSKKVSKLVKKVKKIKERECNEDDEDEKVSAKFRGIESERALSMNPFPGSIRGYPKTEKELEELARQLEEKERKLLEEEKESDDDMNLDGLDLGSGESGGFDGADLEELLKAAGIAEGNEEKEEPDEYDLLEAYRDKLDADVSLRAAQIVTARATRGTKCVADQASLTLRELARLEPCGVLAVCPSMAEKDLVHVGRSLRIPSFLIFGELDSNPGAGVRDAEQLHALLSDRLSEVADLSVRVYEGRSNGFAHSPKTDEDRKCGQEATAIGAIWLDVFSAVVDRTDGTGITRLTDSFSFITNKDIARQTLQSSSIASYLHDDPLLFRNNRLADDM